MKTIKITHQKREYALSFEKIIRVLNILENKKLYNIKEEEIMQLMKKYNLFDNIFLENINNI